MSAPPAQTEVLLERAAPMMAARVAGVRMAPCSAAWRQLIVSRASRPRPPGKAGQAPTEPGASSSSVTAVGPPGEIGDSPSLRQ